jgi:hypothetical protein
MSFQTRIALIGVAGALAGTLAGGLVTWVVTQEQLASQRADARRVERLAAYTEYFGDAARLWTQVSLVYDTTPRPERLSAAQTADLKLLQEQLTRNYARVVLVAPEGLHGIARELNQANVDAWNALRSEPIDEELYVEARTRANRGLQAFLAAAQRDVGTQRP